MADEIGAEEIECQREPKNPFVIFEARIFL